MQRLTPLGPYPKWLSANHCRLRPRARHCTSTSTIAVTTYNCSKRGTYKHSFHQSSARSFCRGRKYGHREFSMDRLPTLNTDHEDRRAYNKVEVVIVKILESRGTSIGLDYCFQWWHREKKPSCLPVQGIHYWKTMLKCAYLIVAIRSESRSICSQVNSSSVAFSQ